MAPVSGACVIGIMYVRRSQTAMSEIRSEATAAPTALSAHPTRQRRWRRGWANVVGARTIAALNMS